MATPRQSIVSLKVTEIFSTKRVKEAEGDAGRFNALLAEYVKAPTVTRRRLYLETMQRIAPTLGQKIILDESAKQILPLLQLQGRVP